MVNAVSKINSLETYKRISLYVMLLEYCLVWKSIGSDPIVGFLGRSHGVR
jgi:hypothetical protein